MGKERVFNQVLDSIPDLVFYKDLQGVYLGCNRAFAEFAGREITDIVGKTDQELFPADVAQTCVFFDRVMLESGDPRYNHEWATHPDGRSILFDTLKAPMRDREGQLLGTMGIARDITSQEHVKQELETTLANFSMFIETINDMIFITDLNGRALYINPAVTANLGFTLAELQDRHLLDVHPPELCETAEQIFAEMLAGQTDICPLPLARKDGVRVPVETRVWMGRWDNQDCLFGFCKDLSGEQEALQRFNKIFQVNPTPMMITTIPEGRILDVNNAFIATFGYKRLEAIGCLVSELNFFTSAEDADRAQTYLSSTEPLVQYEMSVRTRSNQILVGQISGEVVKTQSEDLRLTVMNDLTAIKQAEESLRYQAQFHNMLMKIATEYINVPLDHVHDAINNALREIGLFVDADRVYIFDYDFRRQTCSNTYEWCNTDINPEIDNLQDVPLAEIPEWVNAHKNGVKMQIDDVLALPADNAVRQILEPQSVKSLLTLPLLSGSDCIGFVGFDSCRHVREYSSDEIGLLSLFCEMLVNMRNRQEQELCLKKTKEQAEMASRSKSQFLANMSHEIRTPLNAVMGYLQLLEQQEADPDKQQLIARMSDSADSLLKVINDILDVSKIEAGKLHLEQIPFNLVANLEAIAEPFAFAAREKGLDFILEISDNIPREILGDPLRLRQILNNLCSNAVKFTENGFVQVMALVSSRTDDAVLVELSVADSGPGIAPDFLAHIFEPFAQEDSTLPRRFGGTGLGLSISHELAQLMQGHLQIQSEQGRGSVFTLTLPFAMTRNRPVNLGPATPVDPDITPRRPVPAENSPVWLTRHQWKTFLSHERQLLSQGDFMAADELSRIIDGRDFEELDDGLQALVTAMDQFDFDQALLLVQDMIKSLDGTNPDGY